MFMQFALSIIKNYLKLHKTLSVTELESALNNIGFEVEGISNSYPDLVYAKILSIQKHSNADTLNLCVVFDGRDELQVVCGANNLYVGMQTVLARIGSEIPSGMRVKKSKIRSVVSYGMMCSEKELGLSTNHEGIIDIKHSCVYGEEFFDPVFKLAITPNRGDCLGVLGLARELHAFGLGDLKPIDIPEYTPRFDNPVVVTVDSNILCEYFSGCSIKNVDMSLITPEYITEYLTKIGVKSINIIVDILNYLTSQYNQPLHAYDLQTISDIHVYKSMSNHSFRGLDEQDYILSSDTVVVGNKSEVYCVAGGLGSYDTRCSQKTKDIFVEAAVFNSHSVYRMRKDVGINTDSSYRFERKVDRAFTKNVLKMAIGLITKYMPDAQVSNIVETYADSYQPSIMDLPDYKYISDILGVEVPKSTVDNILDRLGFIYKQDRMVIPSWRNDIEGMPDIVEEIMRIYGVDKIPEIPLSIHNGIVKIPDIKNYISDFLVSTGYYEILTWSFINHKNCKYFISCDDISVVSNPIKNRNILRPSMIFGFLENIEENKKREYEQINFFEFGKVFSKTYEMDCLCVARYGSSVGRNIFETGCSVDFFHVKASLERVLSLYNVSGYSMEYDDIPNYFHPSRSCKIVYRKQVIAYIGEVHPMLSGISVVFFELYLERLPVSGRHSLSTFHINKYPPVFRDFCFVFADPNLRYCNISEICDDVIKNHDFVCEVKLFDRFILDCGLSFAMEIKMYSKLRTLNSTEIDNLSEELINSMKDKLGGILRRDLEG
ncbi:MAG: phenylalanyl-tRNA synthetase, beta subunit [Candidatus Xenolissoclinum pacificiensis L6]|uniref:Phenylalanine--tRNA ligase beta subunit n=1 Tax=Candidatus Xenolissoclinum pacificiensis L6 TaxID=1401685 RepID=W2V0P3_9RICK|nr:MAG: phenylalanyl-tRNA synthetase, beta subunit [Candidatus Xenolissoclinum pacificiensis L6]